MIKKAKHDVDDFYGEITYRSQRKREGGPKVKQPPKTEKGSRGTSQESTTAASVTEQKKLDRLLRKRTLELGECSDGVESPNASDHEEGEESESVNMSSDEDDDNDEGKGRKPKSTNQDDMDLFEGTRFSPGSQAGSTPTPTRVGFDRTLQEMISKAVECGALAVDACLQGVWGEVM